MCAPTTPYKWRQRNGTAFPRLRSIATYKYKHLSMGHRSAGWEQGAGPGQDQGFTRPVFSVTLLARGDLRAPDSCSLYDVYQEQPSSPIAIPAIDEGVGGRSKKIIEMAMRSTILALPAMPIVIDEVTCQSEARQRAREGQTKTVRPLALMNCWWTKS